MESPYQASRETIHLFASLREQAIHHTVSAGQRAMPELYARLTQRGREACAEDIGFHLEFLQPVLESGQLAPFLQYLSWLAEVLVSRHVPLDSVSRSLSDLADFYSERLGAEAPPVVVALQAGVAHLAQPATGHDGQYTRCCPEPWPEAETFRQAAVQGRHREAGAMLSKAMERGGSLAEAAIHIIQPALYEIGNQWQKNKVSVAQEHLATALTSTVMAQQMLSAPAQPANGGRVLLACAPANHHAVGLRILADAFELDGWEVCFLGANTPTQSIIAQVRETRPDVIALSAALPHHLRGLRETLAQLRTSLGEQCPKIMIGGLIFNQVPELMRPFQPDLYATDACSAVSGARQWLRKPG